MTSMLKVLARVMVWFAAAADPGVQDDHAVPGAREEERCEPRMVRVCVDGVCVWARGEGCAEKVTGPRRTSSP